MTASTKFRGWRVSEGTGRVSEVAEQVSGAGHGGPLRKLGARALL